MDNQGSVSGRRSSVSSMTSVDLRVRYMYMYTRLMIDQHKFVQISMIKDKTTVSIGTDFTFTESV